MGQKSHFRLGLGAGAATSEYKDMDVAVRPMPIIHYERGRFFLRGLTGGVRLFKNGQHEFSLNASYMPQNYDAGESGDPAMRQLDDRRPTMMAGASYRLTTDWGAAGISAALDALNTSGGMLIDVYYAYPIEAGDFTLAPRGGVVWASDKFNDYYYGIRGEESLKSGLREYKANAGFSPYAGLHVSLHISGSWNIHLYGNAVFLSREITDSPMVDKKVKYSGGAGLSYSF
ncbi:MAG: MipA/OmpV family protein [Candidatus Adiutrix sp.]|nr:MipA/OmpV family protein [Candidatus Adiutrix sp.]